MFLDRGHPSSRNLSSAIPDDLAFCADVFRLVPRKNICVGGYCWPCLQCVSCAETIVQLYENIRICLFGDVLVAVVDVFHMKDKLRLSRV